MVEEVLTWNTLAPSYLGLRTLLMTAQQRVVLLVAWMFFVVPNFIPWFAPRQQLWTVRYTIMVVLGAVVMLTPLAEAPMKLVFVNTESSDVPWTRLGAPSVFDLTTIPSMMLVLTLEWTILILPVVLLHLFASTWFIPSMTLILLVLPLTVTVILSVPILRKARVVGNLLLMSATPTGALLMVNLMALMNVGQT